MKKDQDILKEAVWKAWLRSVKGTIGNGTVRETIKAYGFTGPFAGLDQDINSIELNDGLKEALGRQSEL